MISLEYSPIRGETEAEYFIDNDILTVKMGDIVETFDFTGLPEGAAEEVTAESLPICPIDSVEKIGDTITIAVTRFYGSDEKHLFESGDIDG